MRRKWLENPGGGISRIHKVIPDEQIKNKTRESAENGQTLLDVSKGDIRITKDGAVGGGLEEDETRLNSKGYWIIGTTTEHSVKVEKDVKTEITLDNVNITCSQYDCINVSHAYVTITLIGDVYKRQPMGCIPPRKWISQPLI